MTDGTAAPDSACAVGHLVKAPSGNLLRVTLRRLGASADDA